MLLLTYMILIVFSENTDYRTKYIGGFATAGIVILIIILNLLAIWSYILKAAFRQLKRLRQWLKAKYRLTSRGLERYAQTQIATRTDGEQQESSDLHHIEEVVEDEEDSESDRVNAVL